MKIELPSSLNPESPTCRRGEGFADQLGISGNKIHGRAVPYDRIIQLMPGVYEVFEEGAFARQAKDPSRVKICLEHGEVVGKIKELQEHTEYLFFAGEVSRNPAIPEAMRAQALIDDDLIDEMSIGFQTVKDGTKIEEYEDGMLLRHSRARLLEISLVPWGAYGREATLSRSKLIDPTEKIEEIKRQQAREWVNDFKNRIFLKGI